MLLTNMDQQKIYIYIYCVQRIKRNIVKMLQIIYRVIANRYWNFHENPFIHLYVMLLTGSPPYLVWKPQNSLIWQRYRILKNENKVQMKHVLEFFYSKTSSSTITCFDTWLFIKYPMFLKLWKCILFDFPNVDNNFVIKTVRTYVVGFIYRNFILSYERLLCASPLGRCCFSQK